MQRYSKFITAAVGFIADVAFANIFTGHTEQVLLLIVSGATALGVYAVPNHGTTTIVTRPTNRP